MTDPRKPFIVSLSSHVDMAGQDDILKALQEQASTAETQSREHLKTPSSVAAYMRLSTNADDWNKRLQDVKVANGGDYPPFWFVTIMISGLMSDVENAWGDGS